MLALRRSEMLVALAAFAIVAGIGTIAHLFAPVALIPVTTASAAAILAIIAWGSRLDALAGIRRLADEASATRADMRGVRAEVEETRALIALQEPRFGLPLPWSAWSIPPRAVLDILKTIQEFEAPTIVDCGSGVSTLHFARAVREIGQGHVIALEEDPAWAGYIRRLVERHGLQAWTTIVEARVARTVVFDRSTSWYVLPGDVVPAGTKVDVLVVDGPKGEDGMLARLGALPHFWERLSERATVFLDDTMRPDEQEICRLWREHYPVTETSVGTEHGTSKFTRRG